MGKKKRSSVPKGKGILSKVRKVGDQASAAFLNYFQSPNQKESRHTSSPGSTSRRTQPAPTTPEESGQPGIDEDDAEQEIAMKEILFFLQGVLKKECKGTLPDSKLLKIVSYGIIQAGQIKSVLKMLQPDPKERPCLSDPEMLKDVLIWIPDKVLDAPPPCVLEDCKGHGGPYDYPLLARRVIGLKNTFFVMSRRYCCRICGKKFMGYASESIAKQTFGIQHMFPVTLTKKQALHNDVVNLMIPLFQAGVRPATMADIIREMHTKEYYALQIKREQRILKARRSAAFFSTPNATLKHWDGFRGKYGGTVPSGTYLMRVYKHYIKSIRTHLDQHVKARPAMSLSVDASYKEAAKLGNFKGEPVFSSLVTATNELGEIRSQFHVVSDSHDQIRRPMMELNDTCKKFNFQRPSYVFTDKPDQDHVFYRDLFDLKNPIEEGTGKNIAPTWQSITDTRVLNNLVQSNLNLVEALPESQRVFAMAYDRYHAMLALSFFHLDEDEDLLKVECIVCNLTGKKELPESVRNMLANPAFVILGSAIPALKTQFPLNSTVLTKVASVDIGSLARSRGVGPPEGWPLENIVRKVLRQDLGERAPLKQKDESFLAARATTTLQCYQHLLQLPDLSTRMLLEDRREGVEVDIVPRKGFARAASGVVAMPDPQKETSKFPTWTTPTGMKPEVMRVTGARCLVEIKEVLAENLIVPGLKQAEGSEVCLGDLGALPFKVVLPLKMLRETNIRTNATVSDHLRYAEALDDTEDDTGAISADASDVARFSEIMKTAKAVEETVQCCTKELGEVPTAIADQFSAVVGDCFHAMDRVRTPTHHAYKKPFFVSLREAFLAWDDTTMEEVKATLKANDWTDEEIKAKLYFDSAFFQRRVPRRILQPSLLYPRVRAVYSVYGNQVDPKTNTPLFNQEAWKKARHVLHQIQQGFLSDPPGLCLYRYKKGKRGGILHDKFGLAMIECSRGTNLVENFHKQLLATFGTWRCGIEMADCLLADKRHRHNHRVAIRKRPNFPDVGHYDSWLIDVCQTLVEANWGLVLFPGWISASDYKATKESFGTVPLHSRELGKAMAKVCPDIKHIQALPEDARFLIRTTGVKVPFLPIAGPEERLLFAKLIKAQIVEQIPCESGPSSSATVAPACNNDIDYERMALDWVANVDLSKQIFPKLPVYLRKYHAHWMKNEAVKQAVATSAVAKLSLENLNQITASTQRGAMEIRSTQAIPPPKAYCNPRSRPISVGTVQVSPSIILNPKVVKPKKRVGQRGKGKREQNQPRRCKECMDAGKGDAFARACPGSKARIQCPYNWKNKK